MLILGEKECVCSVTIPRVPSLPITRGVFSALCVFTLTNSAPLGLVPTHANWSLVGSVDSESPHLGMYVHLTCSNPSTIQGL